MADPNTTRAYRPLRGGVRIVNEVTGKPGTLGLIAVDALDDSAWLVSCYHVLGRSANSTNAPFASGEGIFQPLAGGPAALVARTDASRINIALDCAAARLEPHVAGVPEILGLGRVMGIAPAILVGRRVLKCGIATGVTEGEIDSVDLAASPPVIRIKPPTGFPHDYRHCDVGDSGAVWVDAETRMAVGLHFSGNLQGAVLAEARPIAAVLAALNLSLP